jgi:hypothetical protein
VAAAAVAVVVVTVAAVVAAVATVVIVAVAAADATSEVATTGRRAGKELPVTLYPRALPATMDCFAGSVSVCTNASGMKASGCPE